MSNQLTPDEVISILSRNKNDIAFILGNGINLHYNKNSASWNSLLFQLWDEYSFKTQSNIPQGISFTEFYDILEIENYQQKEFSGKLQKEVVNALSSWENNNRQNRILNKIQQLNAPLLTTNFDDLIPKTLELELRKLRRNSDVYP